MLRKIVRLGEVFEMRAGRWVVKRAGGREVERTGLRIRRVELLVVRGPDWNVAKTGDGVVNR